MISKRAQQLLRSPSPILVAHARCAADPFSATNNPKGFINLGTAENYLVWDLLQPKLAACREIQESDTHYNPTHGLPEFRHAVAAFVNRTLGTAFAEEDLVIANGATAILDLIATTLCEPGEGIIVPVPFYPGFTLDLGGRAEVVILPAKTTSAGKFRITTASLETALKAGREAGTAAKALLITSPGNPLGNVLDAEEIATAVAFANAHGLHCVFDEIYGNSVHDGPAFRSALAGIFDEERTHFIYGFSKDFTVAGFRIGIFGTKSTQVRNAMQALSYFSNASVDTQRALTHLLADERWVDGFLSTNRKRLAAAYATIRTGIESRTPARFWPARAGVFAWLDLSCALKEKTFEAEAALYEELLEETRVNFLPGKAFHSAEPGWFRLCYAQEKVVLETAADRIAAYFHKRVL